MEPTDSANAAPDPQASSSTTQGRERLRFANFSFSRGSFGTCRAAVELEWTGGECYVGRAEGVTGPLGDLRVCSEAALRAVEHFGRGTMSLELVGVKTMRAFDENIVIVSVQVARTDGAIRLLGCHVAEADPLRSAVVAVLHATNRLLGNFIATR
jgi:hypothetical protein